MLPQQRPETIAHVPRGKTLPKEIAESIIDRTDGVPLFIEELTKTRAESGSVVDASDRFYGERTGGAAGNPGDCSGYPHRSKQTCAERGAASIWHVGATEIAKTFSVAARNNFATLWQKEHTLKALAWSITRSVLLTWRN